MSEIQQARPAPIRRGGHSQRAYDMVRATAVSRVHIVQLVTAMRRLLRLPTVALAVACLLVAAASVSTPIVMQEVVGLDLAEVLALIGAIVGAVGGALWRLLVWLDRREARWMAFVEKQIKEQNQLLRETMRNTGSSTGGNSAGG